nr:hypothetical protein [Tanacetum cinerariifolium]
MLVFFHCSLGFERWKVLEKNDDNVISLKLTEKDDNDDQFWSQNKNVASGSPPKSFARVVNGDNSGSTTSKIKFRTMVNPEKIEGLRFNKPKTTFVYRPKQPQPTVAKPLVDEPINIVELKNQFDVLRDQVDLLREVNVGESSGRTDKSNMNKKDASYGSDSESQVEYRSLEYSGFEPRPKQSEVRQVVNENQLSVCAILGSHVDLSSLSNVCSKVFRSWEWMSNASLCFKGCRIIVGWNVDVVHLMVLSQSSQDLHVKVFHNATNKTMFCSFIYVGNLQTERRFLWDELGNHRNVVRGFPWVLMGDFNVALNMEDIYAGSSSFNSVMCEFKDCVTRIGVMDINSFDLHYTWNQKPKGGCGILIGSRIILPRF